MDTSGARPLVPLVLAALGAPARQALAQGCAMCASSFGPDEPVHRAFSWSVLFMIAAVYTVVGGVAAAIYVMHRRAPGRRRAPGGDIS
jgi:hypothetical protein